MQVADVIFGPQRIKAAFSLSNFVGGLFILGGLFAIGMITYAVWTGATPALRGAFLDFLCILLVANFTLFLRSIEADKRISVESEWGGLGGGLGGWRVSASLTFLLISAALFAVLATLINADVPASNLLERYRAAMNAAQNKGAEFTTRSAVGRKLVLRGTVPPPAQEAVEAFWNEAKLANPAAYEDLDVQFTPLSPAAGTNGRTADKGTGSTPALSPGQAHPINPLITMTKGSKATDSKTTVKGNK
jgi:hypothetical protein